MDHQEPIDALQIHPRLAPATGPARMTSVTPPTTNQRLERLLGLPQLSAEEAQELPLLLEMVAMRARIVERSVQQRGDVTATRAKDVVRFRHLFVLPEPCFPQHTEGIRPPETGL